MKINMFVVRLHQVCTYPLPIANVRCAVRFLGVLIAPWTPSKPPLNTKEKSTAKWQIDFKRSRIIYLTTKYSEGILNKFFRYYPNINISVHTLFIEGRLMKFNMDNQESSGFINKVEAITLGYSFGSKNYSRSSNTTNFSCFYR